MRAQQAVAERIRELMRQQGLSMSKLAELSGIPKSVLHGTLIGQPPRVRNTGIVNVQKICQATGISLRDFFDSDLFDGLEYESEK